MFGLCNICGKGQERPERVAARYRLQVAKCELCERCFCEECLTTQLVDSGLMSEDAVDRVVDENGVEALLLHCEHSGKTMCPWCFEEQDEDE